MNWREPTEEEMLDWITWAADRPPIVRAVIEKHGFTPWKLYRLKNGGHRVTIYSFDEPADGSEPRLQVNVSGNFNFVAFERRVFNIKPDDLEECDLPGPDEVLGSANMSIEDAKTARGLRQSGTMGFRPTAWDHITKDDPERPS